MTQTETPPPSMEALIAEVCGLRRDLRAARRETRRGPPSCRGAELRNRNERR